MNNRCRRRLIAVGILLLLPGWQMAAVAQPIVLPRPVPSFNQNYRGGSGAWGDCPLGTAGCPDQIWTTGCLVTVFASVLGYYDIELSVSAEASCTGRSRTGMDPGILNDWLRAHGGYGRCTQDPAGNCCLEWSRLPNAIEVTFYVNRSNVGLNPVASVVIDHALRQGRPVVAGVHWGSFCHGTTEQSEDCHWIILTGKAGETYTIIDPYNPDSTTPLGVRTTLDAGTYGSYIIDRFVVVSGPVLQPIERQSVTDDDSAEALEGDDEIHPINTIAVLFATIAALAAIIIYLSATSGAAPE